MTTIQNQPKAKRDRTVQDFVDKCRECRRIRKGHWEDLHRCWICSECNQETHVEYKFCPNCGAEMVEQQERSE